MSYNVALGELGHSLYHNGDLIARYYAHADGHLWDNPVETIVPDGTYRVTVEGHRLPHGFGYGYFVAATDPILTPVGSDWMRYAGDLVGVWTDTATGKVYFDRVNWYPNYSDAHRHALDNNQLSFWDILNNEEVRLHG